MKKIFEIESEADGFKKNVCIFENPETFKKTLYPLNKLKRVIEMNRAESYNLAVDDIKAYYRKEIEEINKEMEERWNKQHKTMMNMMGLLKKLGIIQPIKQKRINHEKSKTD